MFVFTDHSKVFDNSAALCSQALAVDPKDDKYPDDESQEIQAESGQTPSSSTYLPPDVRYNSAGEPISHEDSADLNEAETGSDQEEELCYKPEQDRPNPGEITDSDIDCTTVDYPTAHEVTNVRQMEYSAKTGDAQDVFVHVTSTTCVAETDVIVDEIQPFSLDEDFDYDNVILTPKYTAEEIQIIRVAMEKVTAL
jgi:hypothetical protein